MNCKKTLVFLWPVAALSLSLLSWFAMKRISFSLEGASYLAHAYLNEYTMHPLYAFVYFTLFALCCAAWVSWRGTGGFIMTLFSAFLLLGPLGLYILGILTLVRY